MLRIRVLLPLLAAALLAAACGSTSTDTPSSAPTVDSAAASEVTVVVHRTETCDCCGSYEEYLTGAGFVVERVMHEDMTEVKSGLGVPDDERSCHTNEVAGYAVEGHVPAEAILQLVADAPEVDGISLAGMPAGSPGMPGEQAEPFVVRTFVDGEVTGEFGRF